MPKDRQAKRTVAGAARAPQVEALRLREVPLRWLLALLVEAKHRGPHRVRGQAEELLGRVTRHLEAGRQAAERRGQRQLAGVLGAPVYPTAPRWRTRGEAVVRRHRAA